MAVNLTNETAVRTSLFVKIQIDEYRTTPSASYASQTLLFSDHNVNYVIDSYTYIPLGKLLSVTSSTSELRPTGQSVSVGISGIPTNSIAEIVNSKIKGSAVTIYRGYFDIDTGNLIGSIQFRYVGFINNYSLEEEFDVLDKTATNSVQFECLSNVDVLSNKIAGRRTNPESMKKFYPSDTSFDNITTIKNRSFDFGASR